MNTQQKVTYYFVKDGSVLKIAGPLDEVSVQQLRLVYMGWDVATRDEYLHARDVLWRDGKVLISKTRVAA